MNSAYAQSAKLLDQLGAGVAVAARDDDLIAFVGEGQRCGATNAG
jgi:hypothetical protein